MNKTTLIIPDLHLKWQLADKIIASVKHDEIIFLGDYFDDFDDTADMHRNMGQWLNESVKQPNRIHLWGNHDQHYGFPYKTFRCSGYKDWKYFCIRDTIKTSTWEKLKWYHFMDGKWLLAHGGLHKQNVPKEILELRNDRPQFIAKLSEFMDTNIRQGLGSKGGRSWIFDAGASRGGSQRIGGITWCDFEREFYPIRGINQIVGHTAQGLGFPKWCILDKKEKISFPALQYYTPSTDCFDDPDQSYNIDLDVYQEFHYGLWDGKQLKINRLADL